jgi:hypothetical protein
MLIRKLLTIPDQTSASGSRTNFKKIANNIQQNFGKLYAFLKKCNWKTVDMEMDWLKLRSDGWYK